jgi:SSS family solute:Na+ symporter
VGLALLARRVVGAAWVITGIVVGEAVVIWLTFSHVYGGHVNVGLIGLVPNLVVVAVGLLVQRARRAVEPVPERTPAPVGAG